MSRLLVIALAFAAAAGSAPAANDRPPNVVLILADDLGYGDVGCYGQERIATPRIDRMAAEGMRFTQHYSGHPVCAPSRCVLMTGLHTGHAYVRNNSAWYRQRLGREEGQLPLPEGTITLAGLLRDAGYATACIGKWGLGGPGNSGDPDRHGFDLFYGYLCQAHAHNHYTDHLWRNGERVALANAPFAAHQRLEAPPDGYERFRGTQYAPDLMQREALDFIRRQRERPFFLAYATTLVHLALQVPEESLAPYRGHFDDAPYLGTAGYLPHPEPRAAYAAMVTHLDRQVGEILDLLAELGLERDTLVLFTSDNGPASNGGTDPEFFGSAGGLRGGKGTLWEGGIRVPMIVRWPDRIMPGSETDLPSGFQDLLPTIIELAGGAPPEAIDGVSFVPTLLGRDEQPPRALLYWETASGQAIRAGRWKGVRTGMKRNPAAPLRLYDLVADPGERHDVAAEHPAIVERLEGLLREARVPSEHFPHPADAGGDAAGGAGADGGADGDGGAGADAGGGAGANTGAHAAQRLALKQAGMDAGAAVAPPRETGARRMRAAPRSAGGPEGRQEQAESTSDRPRGSRQDAGVIWHVRPSLCEPQDAASPRGPSFEASSRCPGGETAIVRRPGQAPAASAPGHPEIADTGADTDTDGDEDGGGDEDEPI
jgi:arylsulfatase